MDPSGNFNFWDQGLGMGSMMDLYRNRDLTDALMGRGGGGGGMNSAMLDLEDRLKTLQGDFDRKKTGRRAGPELKDIFKGDAAAWLDKDGNVIDYQKFINKRGPENPLWDAFMKNTGGNYGSKNVDISFGKWAKDAYNRDITGLAKEAEKKKAEYGVYAKNEDDQLASMEQELQRLTKMKEMMSAEGANVPDSRQNPMIKMIEGGGSRRMRSMLGDNSPNMQGMDEGPGFGGGGPMPIPGKGGLHDPTWAGKDLEVDPWNDPWAGEMSRRAKGYLDESDADRAKTREGLDKLMAQGPIKTDDFWGGGLGAQIKSNMMGGGGTKLDVGDYKPQFGGLLNALDQRAQNSFQAQGQANRQSMAKRGLAGSSLGESANIQAQAGLAGARGDNALRIAGMEAQGRESHEGRRLQAQALNNEVDRANSRNMEALFGMDQNIYGRGRDERNFQMQGLDFRNAMANQLFGQGMTSLNTRTALEQRGLDNAYRDASFADQRDMNNWNQRMQMLNWARQGEQDAWNRQMQQAGLNNSRIGMGMGYTQGMTNQQNQRDMAQYGIDQQYQQQQWQYDQMRRQQQNQQWAQLAGMIGGGIAGGFGGGGGWDWGNAGRGALGMGPLDNRPYDAGGLGNGLSDITANLPTGGAGTPNMGPWSNPLTVGGRDISGLPLFPGQPTTTSPQPSFDWRSMLPSVGSPYPGRP
jgi:hypothetical protein